MVRDSTNGQQTLFNGLSDERKNTMTDYNSCSKKGLFATSFEIKIGPSIGNPLIRKKNIFLIQKLQL